MGLLGTILLDLDSVGIGIDSSAIPVLGNVWDFDGIGAPTTFNLALDQGMIRLHSGTGLLLPPTVDDPTILDLDASPVGVGIADVAGLGINGTASALAISIDIPNIAIDVGADVISPGVLFAELVGDIYLVPVPEPSSFVMIGVGLAGLGLRRFRKFAWAKKRVRTFYGTRRKSL